MGSVFLSHPVHGEHSMVNYTFRSVAWIYVCAGTVQGKGVQRTCSLPVAHYSHNKPKRKIILYCIHDFAMELKCNVFQTRVMGPLTKSR